jgi:hypothetical protein
MEFLIGVIILVFVLAVLTAVVIAPVLAIVAFLRTRGLADLRDRLLDVEWQLRHLQRGTAP